MATTLSNHVISMTANADAWDGWVCIDQIIWRGANAAADVLEINDTAGKSVLEPTRAGSTTEDRTIKMHGKWALGLKLILATAFDQVDIYLKQ